MDKTSAADSYRFETRSGELAVSKTDDGFVPDFPARSLEAPSNRINLPPAWERRSA